MDLAEAIWSCAGAEINTEDQEQYDHKLVVTIDRERLTELGVDIYEEKEAIVDIIDASIPDGYDTSDPDYLEFYNTEAARTALLTHGVTIDVFDANGVHYQMKPGGDVVVVSDPPDVAEGGLEL